MLQSCVRGHRTILRLGISLDVLIGLSEAVLVIVLTYFERIQINNQQRKGRLGDSVTQSI